MSGARNAAPDDLLAGRFAIWIVFSTWVFRFNILCYWGYIGRLYVFVCLNQRLSTYAQSEDYILISHKPTDVVRFVFSISVPMKIVSHLFYYVSLSFSHSFGTLCCHWQRTNALSEL